VRSDRKKIAVGGHQRPKNYCSRVKALVIEQWTISDAESRKKGHPKRLSRFKSSWFSYSKERDDHENYKNIGFLLLSIWLILTGLVAFVRLSLAGPYPRHPCIAAGVVIFWAVG